MAADGVSLDDPKTAEEQKNASDFKCANCGSLGFGALGSVNKRFGVYQQFCSPCADLYCSNSCCPYCLQQTQKDAENESLLLVCHHCQRSVHRDCELQRFPDKALTALYVCSVCEEIRVQASAGLANEETVREDEAVACSQDLGHSEKKRRADNGGCLEDAGLRQISVNILTGKVSPPQSSAATSVANVKATAMNAARVAAAAKATAIEKAAVSAKAAAAAKAALEAAALAAQAAAQVQAQLRRELAGGQTVAVGADKKLDLEMVKHENSKRSKKSK